MAKSVRTSPSYHLTPRFSVQFRYPTVRDGSLAIGVYLSSDAITEERRGRLARGCELLRRSGHTVVMPRNLDDSDGYAAGSADLRRDSIAHLAGNLDVDVLISGWGGKATLDLFHPPGLDLRQLAKRRIPWLGFSDACVLLNAITFSTGLITFYGPNVVGKIDESEHGDLEFSAYRSGWPVFGERSTATWKTLIAGSANGRLIGGDLTSFGYAYLSGVIPVMNQQMKLIFFFECGGSDPRVQRQMLAALELAGFFRRVAGVIIGIVGQDSIADNYVELAARQACSRAEIPLYSCPTFGHIKTENPPIHIGAEVTIAEERPPTYAPFLGMSPR